MPLIDFVFVPKESCYKVDHNSKLDEKVTETQLEEILNQVNRSIKREQDFFRYLTVYIWILWLYFFICIGISAGLSDYTKWFCWIPFIFLAPSIILFKRLIGRRIRIKLYHFLEENLIDYVKKGLVWCMTARGFPRLLTLADADNFDTEIGARYITPRGIGDEQKVFYKLLAEVRYNKEKSSLQDKKEPENIPLKDKVDNFM